MSFLKRIEEAQRAAQVHALGGEQAYQQYIAKRKRNQRIARYIGYAVSFILSLGLFLGIAAVLQWLWNLVVPGMHGPAMSYAAACGSVGLLFLLRLFFR